MAHVEHYPKGSTNSIIHEHDRTAKELKNDVVRSRSHLNFGYGMAADENTTAHGVYEKMMARVNEITGGRKMQDQTHTLGEWIITYPVDECDTVTEDLGQTDEKGRHILHKYHTPKDPEQMKRFFDECWRFVSDRYGAENMLGGWVHMDETTPQIHIDFVPEATSRKTGKRTVSAASLLSLYEKQNFQRDLEKDMQITFHKKGLILNGKGKGDKTPEELREATAKKEAAERDAAEARQAEKTARENEAALRNQLETLQNQIDDLKDEKDRAEKDAADWKNQAETDRKAAEDAQKAAERDYKADMDNLKAQAVTWLKTAKNALTGLSEAIEQVQNDKGKTMTWNDMLVETMKDTYRSFKQKDGSYIQKSWYEYVVETPRQGRSMKDTVDNLYEYDNTEQKQKRDLEKVQEKAGEVQKAMREIPEAFLDVTEEADGKPAADNQLDY